MKLLILYKFVLNLNFKEEFHGVSLVLVHTKMNFTIT